jgi:MYXO-CTERM domain-containing protein
MVGYLVGAVGTAVILATPQAEAAVTAVTFGFGSQYTAADGTNTYWPISPGFGKIVGAANSNYLVLGQEGSGAQGPLGSVYQTGSFISYIGRAKFFANGTVIGNGLNGVLGRAYFQAGNALKDFTSDQLNQNIGFKTSSGNWGWANVSWTEANKTLTFNSAYVESVANTPITITAAPEPSRALLALAGLGGVVLRRRRKQVA